MIRRTVEAQVLQIRDEVRDGALVYALTLAEDIKLEEEHRYSVVNIVSTAPTVCIIYEQQTKEQDCVSTAVLLVSWMKWIMLTCSARVWAAANGKLNVSSTRSTQVTLSNISKSFALGWWMVQMIVRPPRAKDFIRETTWKQDALSKPLWDTWWDREPRCSTCFYVDISHIKTQPSNILPGGLIKEHDRRIVDQLEGDGQSFTLASRETVCACLCTFLKAQSSQDLIHLWHTQTQMSHDVEGWAIRIKYIFMEHRTVFHKVNILTILFFHIQIFNGTFIYNKIKPRENAHIWLQNQDTFSSRCRNDEAGWLISMCYHSHWLSVFTNCYGLAHLLLKRILQIEMQPMHSDLQALFWSACFHSVSDWQKPERQTEVDWTLGFCEVFNCLFSYLDYITLHVI